MGVSRKSKALSDVPGRRPSSAPATVTSPRAVDRTDVHRPSVWLAARLLGAFRCWPSANALRRSPN